MNKLIYLLILIITQGCALTAPKGEKQLMKIIEEDQKTRKNLGDVRLGRPKLVKVRAYRQVEGGDIRQAHWLYLQVGREVLSLDMLTGGQ